MSAALRGAGQIAVGTVVAALTLAGVAFVGAVTTNRSIHVAPPPTVETDAVRESSASHQTDRRLVVAFVAGTSGTTPSDLLAPYDIFASSPAFTTYVVAASPSPVPMVGGPALVPTYTFNDVDASDELAPDLVVVPAVEDPFGPAEAELRSWVFHQHQRGARILGVCAGARVLAATGMLDGRTATSHWSRIPALEKSNPDVSWVHGRVYVDDGEITTTGAVTSGVAAALHLVAELAGPGEAQRVADLHPELAWTPATSNIVDDAHFTLSDWPVGLGWVVPWFRPTIGVFLTDGISELDTTAVFEVWSQSAAARTLAIADDDAVTTRHGLVLLTTATEEAPGLSRRVTPGGGFSAALEDLAAHDSRATASSTAKMLGYPMPEGASDGPPLPIRPVLLGVVGLALAVVCGLASARTMRSGELLRRRRRRMVAAVPTTR